MMADDGDRRIEFHHETITQQRTLRPMLFGRSDQDTNADANASARLAEASVRTIKIVPSRPIRKDPDAGPGAWSSDWMNESDGCATDTAKLSSSTFVVMPGRVTRPAKRVCEVVHTVVFRGV